MTTCNWAICAKCYKYMYENGEQKRSVFHIDKSLLAVHDAQRSQPEVVAAVTSSKEQSLSRKSSKSSSSKKRSDGKPGEGLISVALFG